MLEKMCNLLVKDVDFVFDDECLKAFKQLKAMLTSALIIQPPNWEELFEIMCDTHDSAIGAVMLVELWMMHNWIIPPLRKSY